MASVVGTYARAFADVVMSTKADPIRRACRSCSRWKRLLAESDQLRRVMENPSIPGDAEERGDRRRDTERWARSRPVRNFIAVVTDHRRLAAVQ